MAIEDLGSDATALMFDARDTFDLDCRNPALDYQRFILLSGSVSCLDCFAEYVHWHASGALICMTREKRRPNVNGPNIHADEVEADVGKGRDRAGRIFRSEPVLLLSPGWGKRMK